MKLKVYVIDLELPPKSKRRFVWAGAVAAVLLCAGLAYADSLKIWGQGETLSHDDLNGNFAYLQTQITALQTFQAQATANGAYSLGGVFCGATPATTGQLSSTNGYAAAATMCQVVSGCSSAAHMCTSEELIRTRVLNQTIAFSTANNNIYAWFSSGTNATECEGWTSADASRGAWAWSANANAPNGDSCDNSHPILCCN